jgi:dihydroceramidase
LALIASDERCIVTPVWGPVTASVDWCEANYQWSSWIAEPANTVSSLAMVLAGIYGVVRHRRLPSRYRVANALLALVGVGSVAFHGTLKFELQMLDELPMLYLVLVIVYILVDGGRRLTFGFAFYALALSLMASLTRGTAQFYTFHLSFGSLEVFALAKTYLLQRRGPFGVKRLYALGMSLYALGIAVWFADLKYCAVVSSYALHAVWHVLVSGGFYLLLRVIAVQKVPTEKCSCARASAFCGRGDGLTPTSKASAPTGVV